MLLTGKQFCVALILQACCVARVEATESKDYRKLIELGFANLECAATGMLAASEGHSEIAQSSFLRGALLLTEWLDDVKSGKAIRASAGFAPEEIKLLQIPGPPTQFHVGYIWAQVEMQARKRSSPESSSLFFAFGEVADARVRAEAEKQFQAANCELLN